MWKPCGRSTAFRAAAFRPSNRYKRLHRRFSPSRRREFRLPQPDPNSYAATAYLRKRCIHPNVLSFCKQKKILYQTSIKNHPNCVFVGRDGEGQAKGGSLRGCGAQQFRRDIPGSRKIYPFYIEAAVETDTVEVYEAPIDAMSGASLRILQQDGNCTASIIWRWAAQGMRHWTPI